MAQKLYEETNIQAIADAIREKNGATDTYLVSEMAAAISAIQAGGGGGGGGGNLDFSKLSYATLTPTSDVLSTTGMDLSTYIGDYSQVRFIMYSDGNTTATMYIYIPDALGNKLIAISGRETFSNKYTYGAYQIPGYIASSSSAFTFNGYSYEIDWMDATHFRIARHNYNSTFKDYPYTVMNKNYSKCTIFYEEA